MSELTRANQASVSLGFRSVDGFLLPDSSYRMSLSQTAECVGKTAQGVSNFLQGKTLKRLLGEAEGISSFLPQTSVEALTTEGYTPELFIVDIGEGGSRGQTRIRGLPLEMVSLYWQWESYRGNKQAFILCTGLTLEALERRFDRAFSVTRSDAEYDERLTRRIRQLERDLEQLGEGFALDDIVQQERDYFEQLLRRNGIDPWALPDDKEQGRST